MARDIDRLERYYENVPYGEDSLPSEIHGPESQKTIDNRVKKYADIHSLATKIGDNDMAAKAEKVIHNTYKEVANADTGMKQEHALTVDSQSNYGDMYLMDKICTEDPDFKGVSWNDEGKLLFNVFDDRIGEIVSPTTEDLTKEFVEKGDWMQKLMMFKQELINARENGAKSPPSSIPFFVNNLLDGPGEFWKSISADVDPTQNPEDPRSNGYRLQLVLNDAMDENGGVLPEDYNLAKESFNPEDDTRLFKSLNDELHRAFYGPDMSSPEKTEAESLMAKLPQYNKPTRQDVKI